MYKVILVNMFLLCFYRKNSIDSTYYTSQGIISGGSQMFSAVEGRSTPTGLESACTVSNNYSSSLL